MSKRFKLLLLALLLAIVIAFVGMHIYQVNNASQRPHNTKMALHVLRKNIELYKDRNKVFPISLEELKLYMANHPDEKYLAIVNGKEYISCKEGTSDEYSILNGNGGWYYDKSTGKVRVNLTEPVKYYMKLYFGPSRNEIPSDW